MEFEQFDIYKIAFFTSVVLGIVFFKDKTTLVYNDELCYPIENDYLYIIENHNELNQIFEILIKHFDKDLLFPIFEKTKEIMLNQEEENKIILQLELRKRISNIEEYIPKEKYYIWDTNIKVIIRITQEKIKQNN